MDSQNNRGPSTGIGRRSWAHRILLKLPAETAHNLALSGLRVAQATPLAGALARRYRSEEASLSQALLGQRFANPVGLAAGFDKNGVVIPGMAALGFGWLEVGAVTPRAQAGNPRPRLFRYPEARSLENAMGFNNRGAEALARRLSNARPAPLPVFVNLGRNRTTPNERAGDDYLFSIDRLAGLCDGFVLNVSSPNTKGLRELQEPEALADLVGRATAASDLPLLVKLSPDVESRYALGIADAAVSAGARGLVLSNTTTDYDLLPEARGVGGLSGRVLRERSLALLRKLSADLFGRCLLVSVGGVSSGRDAYLRIRAGASLVQLYSALVFEGPGLARRIADDLARRVRADGFESLTQAVGADLRPGETPGRES